jgi:hypothetical protein
MDMVDAVFETKAFPYPFLYRYRITKAGRLIDACNRDLECTWTGLWKLADGQSIERTSPAAS